MAKTIQQKVEFKKSPHEIYEMLMDSKKHAAFTGEKASISRKAGGKFSAYGGYIEGVTLDLVPDQRIVQKWRGSGWPKGYYSIVIFDLEKIAKGTRLTFTQVGVPDKDYKDKQTGWKEHYWEKMKKVM